MLIMKQSTQDRKISTKLRRITLPGIAIRLKLADSEKYLCMNQ